MLGLPSRRLAIAVGSLHDEPHILMAERQPVFLSGPISDHLIRADNFLAHLTGWAERREDVRALLLVGSFARGQARPDSDLDVILLTRDPTVFVNDTAWIHVLGDVSSCQLEHYGQVTSLRTLFRDGFEVELSVARTDWAKRPFDSGTLRVARDGIHVLFDRDGEARQLAADAEQPGT